MAQSTLAETLRVQRARRGLTLAEAGELIGVNRHTLRNLELGKRMPNGTTLQKLARGYGVSIADLLGEGEPTPASPGKADAPSGPGRGSEELDDLADLLRRLGSPTQHFANPHLLRDLQGMSDEGFYATIGELDKEIEVLAIELESRRIAAIPGTPSYMETMRFWEKTGSLYLALKMLVRARENVEPQKQHVEEIVEVSRELSELAGVGV